ncbi:MAG: transposase [Actinobacteria bacterium]|nr:transposase [Actinomycetota bacterium]
MRRTECVSFQALSKLKERIDAGRLKNEFKVANALGRITSKYPSIAKHYEIKPLYDITSENQNLRKLKSLEVKELESNSKRASLYGCYTITTSHKDLDAKEIWNLYMTLVRVEEAFRSLKSDLGLRPVYHQLAERTAAHLFISVLAVPYYGWNRIRLVDKWRYEAFFDHQGDTLHPYTYPPSSLQTIRTRSITCGSLPLLERVPQGDLRHLEGKGHLL